MDTLAHAIPVVGDRPNGPFPRLVRAALREVCIFVEGTVRTCAGVAPEIRIRLRSEAPPDRFGRARRSL